MAQFLSQDFNGGTNGANVAPNGNGGDNFSQVVVGAGTTFTFSTSSPIEGAASGVLALAASQTGYGRLLFTTAVSRLVARYKFSIASLNAATFTEPLISIRSATTQLGVIALDGSASPNTGKFVLQNSAGTSLSATRSTAACPTATVVDLQIAATPGVDTSTGRLEYAYWVAGSQVFAYDSGTTLNTGTVNPINANFGRAVTSVAEAFTLKMDLCQISELASGWIVDGARTVSVSVTPLSGTAPLGITATGTCTGSLSGVTFLFDWGDGTTTTQSSLIATHTYTTAGTYTVRMDALL